MSAECLLVSLNEQGDRRQDGEGDCLHGADGTVRDPKLSINGLTWTHFIRDTAKPGLWLQRDHYIKIIGSQQRLKECIFQFILRQSISFKRRPREKTHSSVCQHLSDFT